MRDRSHRIGIRFHTSAGSHTKETGLGVDGVQPAIFSEFHPCDVVADCLHFPAGDSRNEHRQIRLAACRGKRAGHVLHFALRVGEFQNQHVFR